MIGEITPELAGTQTLNTHNVGDEYEGGGEVRARRGKGQQDILPGTTPARSRAALLQCRTRRRPLFVPSWVTGDHAARS